MAVPVYKLAILGAVQHISPYRRHNVYALVFVRSALRGSLFCFFRYSLKSCF